MLKEQRGFTLVELLVVLGIVAVLGVVAIIAINPVTKINQSRDARALANTLQVGKALEACVAERMTTGGRTFALATDDCCGTATANAACVSSGAIGTGTGLANYGYGYSSGWPVGVVVNRGAASGTAICASQQRGTDTNYDKYIVGGGKVVTNAAAACASGA